MLSITFQALNEKHFPLMLKWLQTQHVKQWWDPDITWTIDLVTEKYTPYVKGYRVERGLHKAITAFIICFNNIPVGYIQIYNAYQFLRTKTLSGLPENLGAIDIFIGEYEYLKQGLGKQAIMQFIKMHSAGYSHIFVDPDPSNIAAIKCYVNAGFKKISTPIDSKEIWMIKDLSHLNSALLTIQKLFKERYMGAKAVFWGGSVASNQETRASDLDLVIVYESIPNAYREAYIYNDWPIDVFVHDLQTLQFFFENSRCTNGISGLSHMIFNGYEVSEPNPFSKNIKILAQEYINLGPERWKKEQIDKERFFITDVLNDIKYPYNRDEQIASASWLLDALAQFYFRSQNKWSASGKSIIRYLKRDNPNLAIEFNEAFNEIFQEAKCAKLESLVISILQPYGGLLWSGFRSDAPSDSRLLDSNLHKND